MFDNLSGHVYEAVQMHFIDELNLNSLRSSSMTTFLNRSIYQL